MHVLENDKFTGFPDSMEEQSVGSQKFSFRLKQYLEDKKQNSSLRKFRKQIEQIQESREDYKNEKDLAQFLPVFQARLERGESLEDILPEAFAIVLEAIARTKKDPEGNPIELTDSQIMTSLVLNNGDIAELATGEGKTYALIMAAYLNALTGEQVHIFTANDYLAQRDSETNAPIFEALGMKVGCALDQYIENGTPISKQKSKELRKQAYQNLDIVYAKSSTVAFDWEFDQQVMRPEDKMIKRPFHYAIVDEVDSVMIDDANTPLIISQTLQNYENMVNEKNENTTMTDKIVGEDNRKNWLLLANSVVLELRKYATNTYRNSDEVSKSPIYNKLSFHGKHLPGTQANLQDRIQNSNARIFIDERKKTVELTDAGYDIIEKMLKNTGYDLNDIFSYVQNALYAHCILKENVDYRTVEDPKTGIKKVILIDPNTGRDLPDNKLSNGLHQALEVKEMVNSTPDRSMANPIIHKAIRDISKMSMSTAKITHPSFFAKYDCVGGTSGTVSDEVTQSEFKEQYKKKIIQIPRSRRKIAIENPVEVYATKVEKIDAVVNQILECHAIGQPILVGARDIEEAKEISARLEEYQKRPFKELCSSIFETSLDDINILQATKLYCLMTNTEFPTRDRKKLDAMARQVQSLILPEKEKVPLDYRVEKQLQAKLDHTQSISFEAQTEIYRMVYHQEPTSKEEVQNLYGHLHGISFQTLTAENTEREVEIISQAGRYGAITIATAIAGRGTDIALGGNPVELARYDVQNQFIRDLEKQNLSKNELEFKTSEIKRKVELLSRTNTCDDIEIRQLYEQKLNEWMITCSKERKMLETTKVDSDGKLIHEQGKGLYVLGASLNDSIRVDNQLQGRSGRQGNDGESKFMCSLEDPLITQNGKQSDLLKIQEMIRRNPSDHRAIQYVRAAQRAKESIQASIRTDVNRCAKGFDFISNAYYDYRERLLEQPESTISHIFESTSTLLFEQENQEDMDNTIFCFVPLIFSDEEVNTLSNDELKILFDDRVSLMMKELHNIDSDDFKQDFRKKLLMTGDLKFSMFTDQNVIEKQLSLEGMTPNQTTSVEDLLDRITFDQYNEFKNEVILETSVTALYYLRSYLEQRKVDVTNSGPSSYHPQEISDDVLSPTPNNLNAVEGNTNRHSK